jgi:putative NADH-flavin reductase
MKITIIGASRGIGNELLRISLDEGHEVTALLRNPAKLNISNSRLKIVVGDVLDPATVATAVVGNDAVCLCIGIPPTIKPVDVFSRGAECVLSAMGQGLTQDWSLLPELELETARAMVVFSTIE